MLVKINLDRVKIIDSSLNTTGSVNNKVINCEFIGDEWDGLTKVAVYKLQDGSVFNTVVLDNQDVYIPNEVFKAEGLVSLGIYGYQASTIIDEETGEEKTILDIRISPVADSFIVEKGSYEEDGVYTDEKITATQYEVYMTQLSESLAALNLSIENGELKADVNPEDIKQIKDDVSYIKENIATIDKTISDAIDDSLQNVTVSVDLTATNNKIDSLALDLDGIENKIDGISNDIQSVDLTTTNNKIDSLALDLDGIENKINVISTDVKNVDNKIGAVESILNNLV